MRPGRPRGPPGAGGGHRRRRARRYVDAKFENLGRFALSRNLLRASVEDTDGREYRPITLILLPQGTELDRVRFQGDVTKDPLFWQPRS